MKLLRLPKQGLVEIRYEGSTYYIKPSKELDLLSDAQLKVEARRALAQKGILVREVCDEHA